MPTLVDIRAQYPQYNDLSDAALADGIYNKFYSDMPRTEFDQKLGIAIAPAAPSADSPSAALESAQIAIPLPGGREFKPSLIGMAKAAWEGITAPSRALKGEFEEPPATPGVLTEEDIARQRMATQREMTAAGQMAGLISAGGTGAPAGAIGTGLSRPAVQQSVKVTPQELLKAGGAGYNAARSSGIAIDPRQVTNFVAQARDRLARGGFSDEVAPQVQGVLNRLEGSAARMAPEGVPQAAMTASDIVTLRTVLSNLGKQTQDFRPTPQAAAAGMVKSELDDWLSAAAPTLSAQLKEASSNYRFGALGRSVEDKAARAQLNAASANSGMNVENAIRQQVKTILNNPAKLRQFDAKTQRLMREIVEGTATENALRAVGNMLGGGGGLLAAGYGLTGLLTNPLVAAAPVAGWGLKTAANRAATSKIDKVAQSVMRAAPLARQRARALPPLPAQPIGGLLGLLARNPQTVIQLLQENPRATSR